MEWKLKVLAAGLMVAAFFGLLGWAGDIDYCDQVILRMTQEEYDYVKDSLTKLNHSEPSDRQIAHWWAEHHDKME